MCFTFRYLWATHKKTTSRGKLSFASQFQRIQSMVIWPLVLGQNITSVGIWSGGSSRYAVLETESKERGRLGARYNLQSYVPRNLLPPRRPHLLKFPGLPIGWGLLAQHRRLWLTLCIQSTAGKMRVKLRIWVLEHAKQVPINPLISYPWHSL